MSTVQRDGLLHSIRGLRDRRRVELRFDMAAAANMPDHKQSTMQLAMSGWEFDERMKMQMIDALSRR